MDTRGERSGRVRLILSLTLLAGALLTPLVLTACGQGAPVTVGEPVESLDDDGDVTNVGFVTAAADKTLAANTGRFSADYSMDMRTGGASDDAERSALHLSSVQMASRSAGAYDLGRDLFSADGTFEYSFQGPKRSGDGEGVDTSKGEYATRVDGRTVYTRERVLETSGASTTPEASASRWRKREMDDDDLARHDASVSALLGGLTAGWGSGGPTVGPAQMLGMVKKLSGSVTEIDRPVVDGHPTHHLRAEVGYLALMRAEMPADDVDEMDEDLREMSEQDRRTVDAFTIPVDLYVDGGGLVRRVSVDVDFAPMFSIDGRSSGTRPRRDTSNDVYKISTRLDITAIGQPVEIAMPDPAEIDDFGRTRFTAVGSAIGGDDEPTATTRRLPSRNTTAPTGTAPKGTRPGASATTYTTRASSGSPATNPNGQPVRSIG